MTRKSLVRRVNKKLRLTPAAPLPSLWGRETGQTQKFSRLSPMSVCFLPCEGEGAQPRTAADICCLFLLRETQPGANPLPSPAWVLPTPDPPAGRGCDHHGAQHWGFGGAGTHRPGQQLFWIPLSACCGHHLFLSEPFSEAALSGKCHTVTVSPLSLITQLSTPSPSYSPFPQSKSMLIIISLPHAPKFWKYLIFAFLEAPFI